MQDVIKVKVEIPYPDFVDVVANVMAEDKRLGVIAIEEHHGYVFLQACVTVGHFEKPSIEWVTLIGFKHAPAIAAIKLLPDDPRQAKVISKKRRKSQYSTTLISDEPAAE